eukprot:CAMPEP_0181531918 /NCGR_PEP_ID=MMETSP1110-20121109/72349_1 /TAXON_ID=174948 /ORGANISM="Symbiodinium sp., Strain CCMP421" /LENGTH=101 /DNA_ID=CAMNT_0023663005 /DNA_START=647 /DNA_END=953 /DNA_ORIENTATION=+
MSTPGRPELTGHPSPRSLQAIQAKWQSLELHPGSLWRPRKHRSNYQRCEAAGLAGDLGEEVRPAGAKRSQLEAENDLEGSSEGHRNRSLESWFSGLQGLPN